MKMDLETVKYETDHHVAIITLGRPEAMNAFNIQMRADLAKAQQVAEEDDNIRIVVLTGSGRAFSAGADLKDAGVGVDTVGVLDTSIRDYKPLVDGVTQSDKIYIAAINGFAGGVALGLALGADLAVMSEDASVFSPFTDIGLVPDGGASFYFYKHLGYKRAFAAIAECSRLDAKTCLEMGMVNKVVPNDILLAETTKWAHSLAGRAPLALSYSKKILRQLPGLDSQAAARLESEYQNKCLNSEDSASAIKAFISKTKPVFKGR